MMAATLRVFLACSALLFAACSLPVVSGQSTGECFISESELIQHYKCHKIMTAVYLSLNGVIISNNSYILTSDVGIFDSALQCNTDRSDCCRASDHPNGVAQGQWYYPDGREVRSFTEEDAGPPRNFFYRNRDDGIVRLSRYGNPPEANRGRFRCEIPDANGVNVTIFVNIGERFASSMNCSH